MMISQTMFKLCKGYLDMAHARNCPPNTSANHTLDTRYIPFKPRGVCTIKAFKKRRLMLTNQAQLQQQQNPGFPQRRRYKLLIHSPLMHCKVSEEVFTPLPGKNSLLHWMVRRIGVLGRKNLGKMVENIRRKWYWG